MGFWIPTGTRASSLLQNDHIGSGAHPASYSMGTGVLSQEWSSWGVILTTGLHLALKLRMSGVISLFPLSAFIVWTGTIYVYVCVCVYTHTHTEILNNLNFGLHRSIWNVASGTWMKYIIPLINAVETFTKHVCCLFTCNNIRITP